MKNSHTRLTTLLRKSNFKKTHQLSEACFPGLVFVQPFLSLASFALCIDKNFKQSGPVSFYLIILPLAQLSFLTFYYNQQEETQRHLNTLFRHFPRQITQLIRHMFYFPSYCRQVLSFCYYIISIFFPSFPSNIYLILILFPKDNAQF